LGILSGAISMYAQTWVQKASLPSSYSVYYPYFFSISGKLYVCGGWANGTQYNNLYEYDPVANTWTAKASIPQTCYGGASFSINNEGYIVAGNSSSGLSPNVYMYDPPTNTWTQKNDFPGTPRQNTEGFTANGKGYIFAGFIGGSTVTNDMWEYDPIADSWTQKANVPGNNRNGPTAFVVNHQAYVGLGCDVNSITDYPDMYLFDPVGNTYTAVASIPSPRDVPAHFVIGSVAYIGLGYLNSNTVLKDFYKFEPAANTWTQITNFGGPARGWCFSDTIGGKPYVGSGADLNNSIFYNDNWTWAVDTCAFRIKLGDDTTICSGASITLTDTMSNATFLWGTGATSSSISVSTPGSYWLQVTQNGCTKADTINVSVTDPPAPFNLGNDTSYCGSFSRILSTAITSTLWSTGVTAASITINSPGTYWAQITNSCGSVADTIKISDNPIPVVNLGNDTNLCNNAPLTLHATTANAAYQWQSGTTDSTLVVSTSGIYWVNVTVNGCTKRDSIVVSYIATLIFNIGNDTSYCGSFSRTLTAGVAHTIWSTGDTATYITVDSPGTYWGSIIACNDTLSDTITIAEKPVPIVNLGNDTTLCQGNEVMLNAGNSGAAYLWQDSTTLQIYTVTTAGIYQVDVTAANGCTAVDSINITYISEPQPFSIGSDTTVCADSFIVLNAYQSGTMYIWNTGDTTASIITNQTGQYQVIDTNICGSAQAEVTVTFMECTCKTAIPTAFTPNGDGRNDAFGVVTSCPLQNFLFDIYNRWGQKIFESNSISTKWDGTYKGREQPIGVYVWFVHYTDPYTNNANSQSGNVTLLR
jgi:gliding motility-associated-like protein